MPRLFGPGHCTIDAAALPPELQKPKQNRKRFTEEDDRVIIEEVSKQRDWNEIAKKIPGKTGRQCRERYQHYLDPKISQEPWTQEEDELICTLYKQHGPDWARMSQVFNGRRSNNAIKNRWNNHLKKNEFCWPLLPVHCATSPVPPLPVPVETPASPPVVNYPMSPPVEKSDSELSDDFFWEGEGVVWYAIDF